MATSYQESALAGSSYTCRLTPSRQQKHNKVLHGEHPSPVTSPTIYEDKPMHMVAELPDVHRQAMPSAAHTLQKLYPDFPGPSGRDARFFWNLVPFLRVVPIHVAHCTEEL